MRCSGSDARADPKIRHSLPIRTFARDANAQHQRQTNGFASSIYITDAIHNMLKWGGLGFPYTLELAHNEQERALNGRIEPFDAALVTAKSPGATDRYPASLWTATASSWLNAPSEPLEPPPEFPYPQGLPWPSSFVDGMRFTSSTTPPTQDNPQFTVPGSSVPLVRDAAEWTARLARLNAPNAMA